MRVLGGRARTSSGRRCGGHVLRRTRRAGAWLLVTMLGLAGCSAVGDAGGDTEVSGPTVTASPPDGSVVAGVSRMDWETVLSEPPASRPGVIEVFTGVGDARIDMEQPLPIVVVQAHHTGSADFVVRAIRDDGAVADAVDVVGAYTGEVLTYEGNKTTVGFEVRADGSWALLALSLVTAPDGEDLARQYEGAGDAVVGFPMDFDDPTPVVAFTRVSIRHDGEADFVVRPMFGGVLVDEAGRYDDTVRLPAHGLFGLEITADGPWTVTFE